MQKGYTQPIVILLFVIVAGLFFYIGTKYQPSISLPKSSNQSVSTQNANLNEEGIVNTQQPVGTANITPLQAKSNPDTIVAKGVFQYSDNKINYTFSFPKAGGDVTGTLEGVCNGTLTGKYNGGKENSLSGTFEGKCTAGPILFIKPTVKATYTGDVDQEKGKIYIHYNMTEPREYLGYFELDIQK